MMRANSIAARRTPTGLPREVAMRFTVCLLCLCGFSDSPMTVAAASLFSGAMSLPDFDALWNYADPAATEAKFREILPAVPEDQPAYRLELLTQIARCQGLQDQFEAAHVTLDEVEKSLDRGTDRTRIRYLLERGRVLNSSGRPADARPLFVKAYDIGLKSGEMRLAIDAGHMIAIVEPKVEDQIAWNLKCLELIEKHPDQDRWRRAVYINLGEAYRSAKQYDRALDSFTRVIEWYEKNGKPVDRYARVDQAKMLRMTGHPAESLDKMRALETELNGEVDGFVTEEIAECLLVLGRESEAAPLFRQAWEKLKDEKWLERSEPDRYQRLRTLAATP